MALTAAQPVGLPLLIEVLVGFAVYVEDGPAAVVLLTTAASVNAAKVPMVATNEEMPRMLKVQTSLWNI